MKQSILSLLLVATGGVKVTKGQNSTEPGSGQWRICGVNYTQVLKNCNTNPKCPTGDNCPVGYTCYQLSEDLCPPLTSAPSTATTTAPSASNSTNFASAFSVCAVSFSEATNLCYDPTKTCATCNNATEACFNVRPYQCTTGGETGGETGGNNTDAPTAVQAQTEPPSTAPSLAPTTAKPTPSPTIVTVAPTTPNRFFCATNWDTVDDNCNTATPCPNGQRDCTTAGMTCYEIQSDKCMGTSTTSPTVGTSGSTSAPVGTSGSTSAPVGTSGSTSAPTPTSGFSFATKAPSPSGVDPTIGSSSASPDSSPSSSPIDIGSTPSPTYGAFGFSWTTPAPNGSSTLKTSFVLKSILVAASGMCAALAMFEV